MCGKQARAILVDHGGWRIVVADRRHFPAGGTRGFRAGGPVSVIADAALALEPNVVVRGRLEAGKAVISRIPEAEGGLELMLAGGL